MVEELLNAIPKQTTIIKVKAHCHTDNAHKVNAFADETAKEQNGDGWRNVPNLMRTIKYIEERMTAQTAVLPYLTQIYTVNQVGVKQIASTRCWWNSSFCQHATAMV